MAILSADNLFRSLLPPQPFFKDTATAEAAGWLHSSFYIAGFPGAAVAPSPGLAGAALTSYAGQIPFPAPASGKNVYLAATDMADTGAGNIGAVYIFDRLWHNSGIVVTTTTGQTINSVAFPARDLDGTINGRGIQVAIEVSTATGNGGNINTTTMSYTNSLGVAGRTATLPVFPATAALGTIVPFVLQAGDVGVQSIQSITLGTSYVSGAIHLVAYRHIAVTQSSSANTAAVRDALQLGLPLLWDNSVPWAVYLASGTALGQCIGSLTFAQG